jgi:hypothetical protein
VSRTKEILLSCCFCMFSTILLAAEKEYSITSSKQKTAFPFKVFNNILIVDVRVNGKDSLKFIFDSGCKSTIIIHPKWLNSFEIPYKQKVYFSGLGYKDSIETMKIDDGTLELGTMKAAHIPIYILSKDTLNIENYLGTDVDGIFGAEVFEQFYVHINYKTRQIELYNKLPVKKIDETYRRMNVEIRKSKAYLSCMIMNNKNEHYLSELLLDTGANIPVIIKNADPADINISNYIDAEIGEGLSGSMYSKICRIRRLYLDGFKLDSVVTAFSETPITLKEVNENTLDGNIGNDILNRFDVYYAFPDKHVYFKPLKNIGKPFEFNVSNIILLENKSRNDGFIVKSVAGNSPPLLAGLQEGDEIIKIDAHRCAHLSLEDALSLLNRRIGKKINLQFIRNNQLMKIDYIITSII